MVEKLFVRGIAALALAAAVAGIAVTIRMGLIRVEAGLQDVVHEEKVDGKSIDRYEGAGPKPVVHVVPQPAQHWVELQLPATDVKQLIAGHLYDHRLNGEQVVRDGFKKNIVHLNYLVVYVHADDVQDPDEEALHEAVEERVFLLVHLHVPFFRQGFHIGRLV